MSALFKQPKVPTPPPTVDPTQTENRKADIRLLRLRQGGSGSTMLTSAMPSSAGNGGPRSTLTGMG